MRLFSIIKHHLYILVHLYKTAGSVSVGRNIKIFIGEVTQIIIFVWEGNANYPLYYDINYSYMEVGSLRRNQKKL